ncbi:MULTISPECIES: hypothetical protein [unclassified Thermosipho (in: thermotogales)]|uniref:hypothetical protein n=1 Tax=unclassified Thermosipho (in: thermotogales) TaxID=2676525 RepID=UPI00117C4317|nr:MULTISPECIES: hypothetical protein [unclassified Thermosipho (in: thermotogales)]
MNFLIIPLEDKAFLNKKTIKTHKKENNMSLNSNIEKTIKSGKNNIKSKALLFEVGVFKKAFFISIPISNKKNMLRNLPTRVLIPKIL